MKHSWKLNLSELLLALLSIIGLLLWLNNLWSAGIFYRELLLGNSEWIAGGIPFLRWSTVDQSTVTTFLPFFGFTILFFRVRELKHFHNADFAGFGEDWPFFPNYERLNIALGLIGTIWGIVLVGFYPSGDVSIAVLMSCLHTAMFSTLMAVGFVMVLVPALLAPWMRRCAEAATGKAWEEEDSGGLDQIAAAEQALASLTRALRDVDMESAAISQQLHEVAPQMNTLLTQLEARNQELSATQQLQNQTLATLNTLLAQLEKSYAAKVSECDRVTADLQQTQEQLQAEQSARQNLEAHMAALRKLMQ